MSRNEPNQLTGCTISNRYLLKGIIGNGGYGVVYEGQDMQNSSAVAVKLLKQLDAVHRPTAELAIRREASVGLSHPNIASPIDGGEHDGHPYVVSQLAPGQTIDSALTTGWVPTDAETAHTLTQTLQAAQTCHDAGIIHRDMSTRNVLLDRTASHVTVIDFGSLYKLNDPNYCLDQHYHATPGLIPPEILDGRAPEPNPKQDLFAIGALGHQLLTGDTPFPGDTPDEVNHAVKTGARIRISEIIPHANPALVEVVDRMMSHNPEKRYASANEALNALSVLRSNRDQFHAAAASPSFSTNIARCSHCGHRSKRPACQTCGRRFLPGMVLNLWESVTAVHSTYFIAEGDHIFGRGQVDPRDRTISRQQLVISAGQHQVQFHDGGAINATQILGVSPGGLARPGTTLFTFGRFTGHLTHA